MTASAAPAPTSARAATLTGAPRTLSPTATAAPALAPSEKDGASRPPVAPAPSVAPVSSGLRTTTPTSAAAAPGTAGELRAAWKASRPLPGRTASHSEAAPVTRPAAPIAGGRPHPSGIRWRLARAQPPRARRPSPAATAATGRQAAAVGQVSGAAPISRLGRPPEWSQETATARQETATDIAIPRRRVPATMTSSTA